ncbi:receptor [Branchiostoma belcheri]|nr:receptor [Branchiostoma belcheri]
MLFLYFLPLAVCLFTCSAIVYRLYNRFQPDTNQMDTQRKKQTRRTACMVIGVVAVFAVCWLPNHVINLWAMLTEVKEITNTVYWIKVTALILTYINSATNPFIYAMAGDDFRTCVKSAFCAAKEKKQPGLTSRTKTPKTTSSSSGRPLMVPAKLRKSPVLVRVEVRTVRPHVEAETTV